MPADTNETQLDCGEDGGRTRAGKVRLRSLSDLDGRTAAYRRFRELVASYTSDIGGDPSTAEAAIVQRIVSLQVWLEDAEASYANNGNLDIATYTTASNALRRLLADIGLDRRSRNVTPTITQYAAAKAAEKVVA